MTNYTTNCKLKLQFPQRNNALTTVYSYLYTIMSVPRKVPASRLVYMEAASVTDNLLIPQFKRAFVLWDHLPRGYITSHQEAVYH